MIPLNLTDREAATLYMKFDMLMNGNGKNEVLNTIFEKLHWSILARQSQDYPKEEIRFNILDELQLSKSGDLRK